MLVRQQQPVQLSHPRLCFHWDSYGFCNGRGMLLPLKFVSSFHLDPIQL